MTSYGYRTIGIIVDMTPRVTYDGDVILEITVENSARGQDSNIAGQNLPSFFSRKVSTKLRLRDGESNLLAGLLREDERKALTGFPGILRLPIVKQLFSNNDNTIRQTDIVMLLTPRIIRTHELRAQDLSPIYIGTQSNMSLTGPPATIGSSSEPEPPAAAGAAGSVPLSQVTAGAPALPAGISAPTPAVGSPSLATQPAAAPVLPTGSTQRPVPPPTASPIPGMVMPPAAPPVTLPSNVQVFSPPPDAPAPVAPPPPPVAPPAPAPANPVPGTAAAPSTAPARITLSPPSEMRVASGPYTVPISISGAERVSTLTLSITYNPALIRIRNVQEGTFMRQGGSAPAFSSQIDDKSGRIDIVITRPGDKTGASTSGLLAALLVEPIVAGTGSLGLSGSASIPGGNALSLQFLPAGITVR